MRPMYGRVPFGGVACSCLVVVVVWLCEVGWPVPFHSFLSQQQQQHKTCVLFLFYAMIAVLYGLFLYQCFSCLDGMGSPWPSRSKNNAPPRQMYKQNTKHSTKAKLVSGFSKSFLKLQQQWNFQAFRSVLSSLCMVILLLSFSGSHVKLNQRAFNCIRL